jgi:integrase
MTLGEYLTRWIRSRSQALAPRTVEQYARIIRHCDMIGGIELDKLTVWDVDTPIQAALADGHARTAEQIYVLLRTALGDAQRLSVIDHSPVDRLLRPKVRPAERGVWSVDDTRTFVRAAMADRQCLGLLLPILCGLRRGEVLGLTWEDVDMAEDLLHIKRQLVLMDDGTTRETPPKSAAGRRDVPIPELLRPLLAARRSIGGRVVDLSHGGLRRALERVCERSGVPYIGLHGLRHTFATNVIRSGGDMRALQVVLGHANFNTTAMIYTHPDADQFRTIIAQSMRLVV